MRTPERVVFRALTNVRVEGECVISRYSTGSHGYAQIGWTERGRTYMRLVHRVAWEHFNGPIPDGLTIDHACRNRRCCNVAHLRLMTNIENATDNGQANKTHCPKNGVF